MGFRAVFDGVTIECDTAAEAVELADAVLQTPGRPMACARCADLEAELAELRGTAVQQLGMMGAHAELSQLYAKETSVDVKKQIIQAMFTGGNSTRMIELAKTEQNPELRRTAIRSLGMMGGKTSGDALVEIYGTDKNQEVRRSVI